MYIGGSYWYLVILWIKLSSSGRFKWCAFKVSPISHGLNVDKRIAA